MLKKVLAVVGGVLLSALNLAYATVPTGVDTAISGAAADGVTVGGYIIAGVASLLAIAWILGMMRKH
jgi:hypothetical protein